MSSSLPDRPDPGSSVIPYRLSGSEVEAVIRRAVELQVRETESGAGGDGITADELVRMSTELGLSRRHIQQALVEVEVAGDPAAEHGLLWRLFGPGKAAAARTVSRPAAEARRVLDEYLRGTEAMVVQRRIGDLTVYEEGAGIGAALTRVAAKAGARHAPLHLKLLEAAVRPIDDGTSYVAIAADLGSRRNGAVAGAAVGGSVAAASTGLVLATAFVPVAAVAGLPLLAIFQQISRAWYRGELARVRTRLESLLDRLEHRELDPPTARSVLGRFGI
jgi:hypothetical protein